MYNTGMSISFDKHKIIKWSGSAAKLIAIAKILLLIEPIFLFLSVYSSLTTEARNTNIISLLSIVILTLLESMVFFGYSRLVIEFLDKKDEKRS